MSGNLSSLKAFIPGHAHVNFSSQNFCDTYKIQPTYAHCFFIRILRGWYTGWRFAPRHTTDKSWLILFSCKMCIPFGLSRENLQFRWFLHGSLQSSSGEMVKIRVQTLHKILLEYTKTCELMMGDRNWSYALNERTDFACFLVEITWCSVGNSDLKKQRQKVPFANHFRPLEILSCDSAL